MTGKFVMKDYDSLPPADEMLRATLSRIEDSLTFSNGKEGARFRFDLTDHAGWSATALCSGELDLHNQYGRILSGLVCPAPASSNMTQPNRPYMELPETPQRAPHPNITDMQIMLELNQIHVRLGELIAELEREKGLRPRSEAPK